MKTWREDIMWYLKKEGINRQQWRKMRRRKKGHMKIYQAYMCGDNMEGRYEGKCEDSKTWKYVKGRVLIIMKTKNEDKHENINMLSWDLYVICMNVNRKKTDV